MNVLCKRTVVILLLALGGTLMVAAQDITSLWLSMPMTRTPYLTLEQRREMVQAYNIGVDARVQNALQGTSYIDTLAVDFARITLSSPHDIQLFLLPQEEGDSIMAVIESYRAPATQSNIEFYDLQWQKLPNEGRMPALDISALLVKPDTMSIKTFEEVTSWVEPTMVAMTYNPSTAEIELSLSIPYIAREERELLESAVSKCTLKWGGHSFVSVIKY